MAAVQPETAIEGRLEEGVRLYNVRLSAAFGDVLFHAASEQAAHRICTKLDDLWAWDVIAVSVVDHLPH